MEITIILLMCPNLMNWREVAEIPTPQLLPGSSPESLIQYSNVYTMSAMLQSNLSTIPINQSAMCMWLNRLKTVQRFLAIHEFRFTRQRY